MLAKSQKPGDQFATRMKPMTLLLPLTLLIVAAAATFGQDLKTVLDLRGRWKFEVGDDMQWAEPSFNDKDWVSLVVPSQWETQGFPGYDGYAWYRKTFFVPADWAGKRLYLDLGYIDDVDETYINGRFVAFTGLFPPVYETAYGNPRLYPIPMGLLIPGKDNVIAVRVYDSEMGGGIVKGKISIKEDRYPLTPDQNLEGIWKFKPGDNLAWSRPNLNEAGWKPVNVPAFWETEGLKNYNGAGWYRLTFKASPELQNEHLILFLGKIDDFEEVYLNGEKIGKSGSWKEVRNDVPPGESYWLGEEIAKGSSNEYRKWRAYTIPAGLLKFSGKNVIAVRVFDYYMHGGIYSGPIGLVTREKYMKWEPKSKKSEDRSNPWKALEWIFN
ncbi:MAG: glycoside hydrolase [Bacteroidetes bacterium]|nr:glycoside hydrolase [Bacteroidota bacterium]